MSKSKTERIVKLEVDMDHLKKDQDDMQQEIRENHIEVQSEFKEIGVSQQSMDTSLAALNENFKNHSEGSKQRQANKWKWLQYLMFPLALGGFLKLLDWVFK